MKTTRKKGTVKGAIIVDMPNSVIANDGLQNLVTSMGSTTRDPATQTRFVTRELKQGELDLAYRNWLVRKCVDIPVDDAFRKDRYITTDEDDTDAIKRFYDLEKTMGIKAKFVEAAKLGRLYGGAVILIGTNDVNWVKPLTPTSVLTHLTVLGRYEVTKIEINTQDVRAVNYRQPEFYFINSVQIHYTRVIRFDGDLLPYQPFASNSYWHGSIVQRLADAIEPAQSAIQNCATLINQASTDVFKTPRFMEKLASLGEESAMIKRFQTAAMMRSNLNMMVLDSEEEYIRLAVTLTGLPDAMMSFLRICAGAADIPATRLLGDAASGLNATGEGDQNNYYDHVASNQNVVYAPRYDMLDPLLCYQIWKSTPVGFKSQFEPLKEMSDMERADLELKRAQRDNIYLTAGVLTPAIIARQLQEDETYAIDKDYVDTLESYVEPEPPAPVIVQAAPTENPAVPTEEIETDGQIRKTEAK